MSTKSEIAGPYIVWENYGYAGWQPKSYSTLKEALTAQRYNSEFVITRLSDFEVVEQSWKCKAQPTAADPQDCDWPFCGCDPKADEVLAAISECGMTIVPDKQPTI